MKTIKERLVWMGGCFIGAVSIVVVGCADLKGTGAGGEAGKVNWATEIKPLFESKCVGCHNLKTMPNRVSFESRDLAMGSGASGPVIVPGKPDESRIVTYLKAPWEKEEAMPPVGHRVSEAEITLIRRWITEGAPWPTGAAGKIVATDVVLE
jgi:mono/diheme cytochrome c family protein